MELLITLMIFETIFFSSYKFNLNFNCQFLKFRTNLIYTNNQASAQIYSVGFGIDHFSFWCLPNFFWNFMQLNNNKTAGGKTSAFNFKYLLMFIHKIGNIIIEIFSMYLFLGSIIPTNL